MPDIIKYYPKNVYLNKISEKLIGKCIFDIRSTMKSNFFFWFLNLKVFKSTLTTKRCSFFCQSFSAQKTDVNQIIFSRKVDQHCFYFLMKTNLIGGTLKT